jgi:hypothetical protein
MYKAMFVLAQEFEELSWLRDVFLLHHLGQWSRDPVQDKSPDASRLSGGVGG